MFLQVALLGIGLIIFAMVYRRTHPNNSLTPLLIPRYIGGRKQPKVVFRQVGTAWLVWSVTLFALTAAIVERVIQPGHSNYGKAFVLFMVVSSFVTVILQIVGWYYLALGVFSRTAEVRPGLQSMYSIEPDRLAHDVSRLGRCALVNIISLFLTVAVPACEAAFQVEPRGLVVLLNVSFLITFILSLWRLRYHLGRSRRAMEALLQQELPSRSFRSSSELLIWYDVYRIRKYYFSRRTDLNPATPASHPHSAVR
jgi:hypothetical protein